VSVCSKDPKPENAKKQGLRNGKRKSIRLLFPQRLPASRSSGQYYEQFKNGGQRLDRVCKYLGYEGISTHSFRKWYATEIYRSNGCDIALVQRILQHSSAAVTQRYIGIEPQRIEKAIEGHAELI
jgi:integrase